MVPTTLFKFVRSSSHEQSVPTCMNKSVNNTVQAGQLNHVQAGQLNHFQAGQLKCSIMFKLVNSQKQAVRFYVCRSSVRWNFNKTISLTSFVCDLVFLQHGRQNLCFLTLKGLIANYLLLDICIYFNRLFVRFSQKWKYFVFLIK